MCFVAVENFTQCSWVGQEGFGKWVLEREPEADQTSGVRSGESIRGSEEKIFHKDPAGDFQTQWTDASDYLQMENLWASYKR